jgi:hypothetical protein
MCTPNQIYSTDQNENEMSGACRTFGGKERCIQGFGVEF